MFMMIETRKKHPTKAFEAWVNRAELLARYENGLLAEQLFELLVKYRDEKKLGPNYRIWKHGSIIWMQYGLDGTANVRIGEGVAV